MATLEQQRAAFALEKVRGVVQAQQATREKYKTQLLKLPARLHTNGFGQTVAFYLTAGADSAEVAICAWLEAWLRRPGGVYPAQLALIDAVTGKDMHDDEAEAKYRQASDEARALAVWLKRFAEAFIEAKPPEARP